MSQRVNLGATLTVTVLVIIIGVIVITGSQENADNSKANRLQSEKNARDIQYINATLTDFIEDRNAAFNKTFDYLDTVVNVTHSLTSDEYNRAAEKKVENILGNMTEQHEIIFKALNITKTETNSEDKKLGQLLKEFIQAEKDAKVKPNQPQGPKS